MKRPIALALALIAATPAASQSALPIPPVYGAPISLDEAQDIVRRGIERSLTGGVPMALAVVEPSGELVAFARMDGVPYASTRIAQQKARTAARLRMPTASLEARVQDGRMALLSSDEVIAIGGGVPIVADGKVIGAVGVSGGSALQDHELASSIIARD